MGVRSRRQKIVFLFFLFAAFLVFLYLSPRTKYDEQFFKTIKRAVKEQAQEKLPPNLESFCDESGWSKQKCRQISELHAHLDRYTKYLNRMSIGKDQATSIDY